MGGSFKCTYGDYGEEPRCMAPGASYRSQPYVRGTVRASVTMISTYLSEGNIVKIDAIELALNRSFWEGMKTTIAIASNATMANIEVLTINGITQIGVLKNDNDQKRRRLRFLQDANLESLSPPAELEVVYKVKVATEKEANALMADI